MVVCLRARRFERCLAVAADYTRGVRRAVDSRRRRLEGCLPGLPLLVALNLALAARLQESCWRCSEQPLALLNRAAKRYFWSRERRLTTRSCRGKKKSPPGSVRARVEESSFDSSRKAPYLSPFSLWTKKHHTEGQPHRSPPMGKRSVRDPCDRWREASYGSTPLLPRLGAVETREWRPPPRTSKISTKTELKMTPGGSPPAAEV
jgi:hypothetical protein